MTKTGEPGGRLVGGRSSMVGLEKNQECFEEKGKVKKKVGRLKGCWKKNKTKGKNWSLSPFCVLKGFCCLLGSVKPGLAPPVAAALM